MLFSTFNFGLNWKSYSKTINEFRLDHARNSLVNFIGEENIRGKTFLDVGCGSGLFAIAACEIGAKKVVGIDVDPMSIETSTINADKWIPGKAVSFLPISVLDGDAMNKLGKFDLVYSWGVLHHTGNMYRAITIAADRVKPRGKFMISIYNRHITSGIWKVIKRIYNVSPTVIQRLLIWIMAPVIYFAKFIVTRRNPLTMGRGMEFMHNVIDWVGGFPYEYARIDDMKLFLSSIGLRVDCVSPALVPTGCNEYLCSKPLIGDE
jgi:2-polyprenyl-6-hydroxyphenyl methylase/3-demethylubiquinone-9 3-methyltransferase